jgi:hypothetical protein
VIRSAAGLRGALRAFDAIEAAAGAAGADTAHALAHPLLVARRMAEAALARTGSVGSHYRSDDPRALHPGHAGFNGNAGYPAHPGPAVHAGGSGARVAPAAGIARRVS